MAPNKDELDKLILRSIDCAQRMGIPWVAIHAGTDYQAADMRKKSFEKNREYFLPLLEYAEKRNVGIAIENLWDLNIAPRKRYTTLVEDLIDLVDSLDCPNVGICYDVEHAAISCFDPADTVRLIGKRLKATHLGLLGYEGKPFDSVQWSFGMGAFHGGPAGYRVQWRFCL